MWPWYTLHTDVFSHYHLHYMFVNNNKQQRLPEHPQGKRQSSTQHQSKLSFTNVWVYIYKSNTTRYLNNYYAETSALLVPKLRENGLRWALTYWPFHAITGNPCTVCMYVLVNKNSDGIKSTGDKTGMAVSAMKCIGGCVAYTHTFHHTSPIFSLIYW